MRESIVVAQLGARMHYAVPRIFENAGILERFYTDICAVKGWPQLARAIPQRFRTPGLKRLLARVPQGVPTARIRAFTDFGWEYARRRRTSKSLTEQYHLYMWGGENFSKLVLKEGFGSAAAVYTFNTEGLEILQAARRSGLRTILEQTIAPFEFEYEILSYEHERYPNWATPLPDAGVANLYSAREREEWKHADTIICGSAFVRDQIAAHGGPANRCVIVPYGIDRAAPGMIRRHISDGPLRVLTVGEIGLRKGAQYVLGAAERLKSDAQFRMVGPIGLLPNALERFRQHVDVLGPVPRSEMVAHYDWADVFLLPSLCEGSATATYEALAHGLPVITTANAGSVIRDHLDGFIVPIRDAEAIAEKILLLADEDRLRQMSESARRRAASFTVNSYGERLLDALLTPVDTRE